MAAYDKQFLDTDGLNTIVTDSWEKIKQVLPFHHTGGHAGTKGYNKILIIKCDVQMNKPIAVHIISRGYSTSTVEITFQSQTSETTPSVYSFVHRIHSYQGNAGKSTNVGYTYEDIDNVRYYTLWKQKNEEYGHISVHVDCISNYTQLLTIPTDEYSDTEPTGIVYATEVWETVPKQTAYSAKGSATKVPQITTNAQGQVTGITEVTISGVTPASHTHGNIANGGTLTDTAAAASGNDYVVIRDADNAKIQTSTIKGTNVADAVSKKHSHSTLTLSTTAQAYDGSHTLALPSTDPYTSARTPSSHTHGNIQNGGTLQTNDITIASGDKLVVTDSSDSNKVARTSVSFDGSTTTTALTPKGTFESFAKAGDISTAIDNLDSEKTSTDGTNVQVKVTEADGKISAVNITTDTTANRNEGVYYVAGTTDYPAWVANHAYAVNDNVISGGKAYYCKTAHTSGSSFDSSKWTDIATPVIKGTISGVTALYTGIKIALKWPITGGSSSTYLNINNLGNVYIRRNDGNITTHIPANSVSFLAYDGTYWRWADYDSNSTYSGFVCGYCNTAAGTAAKEVSATNYSASTGNVIWVRFTNTNSAAGALTLKAGGVTKTIKWNGTVTAAGATSAIPAGTWPCYYDGTNWNIWTDGTIQGPLYRGIAANLQIPRKTGSTTDINSFVSSSRCQIVEFGNDVTNRPTNAWTHVISMQGSDTAYATQLAVGMTTGGLWYRNMGASTWHSWTKVATSTHTHGNITNGGAITATGVALASGDSLAFVDSSDSSLVKKTSITFDGSTTTKALTQKGTWETFNNYSHPAGSAPSKTGVPTGNASPGFGGTFKVNQITTDSTSHVSAVTERTITIPNSTATTSAAGLMSASDKTKLDNAEDNVVYSSATICYGILLTELTVSTSVSTAEYVGTIYLDANFGIQNQTKEIIDVKFVFRNNSSSGNYLVWHANAEHHMSHLNSAAPVRIAYKTDANKAYIYLLWNAEGSSTAGIYAVRMKTFSKWGCATITYPLTILSAQLTGFTLFTSNYMVKSALRTAVGGTNTPVYVDSSGEIQACTTYAGGTAVTLNNSSKAGSTASFYAPTAGGTANYVLIGNGTTSAPTWTEKAPKAVVADYLNMLHTNEVNFKNVPTSGNKERVWFNYRNGDTDAADSTNLVTDYYFGNRNQVTTGVTLHAANFDGLAAKATGDADGNSIKGNYLKTTSGTKSLSFGSSTIIGTVNGANVQLSLPANPNTDTKQRIVASDSKTYITGVTTAPTSSNQDLTGVANTNVYATAGQLHATTFDVNSKCTLQFNTTTNALDFVFA